MLSIIVPTLNEEKFLPKLLTSLTKQTNNDFEVIVVDGKSKDKTVLAAQSFGAKLPKLKIIISPKASLPLQRNLGAKNAKGEWFIFVDADSVLMEYFMDRVSDFINEKKPSVFTTWFKPDSEIPKDAIFTLLANLYFEGSIVFKQPHPPGPLSCIRRDIFERVGGYSEAHHYLEDVDLGIRLKKLGIPLTILRETLFVWSLRRFRREGTLKVLQQYSVSSLPVFFFQRAIKNMPGYIMGGHVYGKKRKSVPLTTLKTYERRLKNLMSEFFK